MNDIKFRNLNLSLIVPFVLFQKKYTDELNGNIFSKKETIRNLKNKYYYTYLCLQKDTIVGFLSAQKILDTFEIHSLFVSPNLRRKGIAMTLVQNLINSCKRKKITNVFLEVMELNKAAKNLYFKNNFIIYGKREKYYKLENKEFDANLMKLKLR